MPTNDQHRRYAEDDPTFVHARPADERRRRYRSYRTPLEPPPQQPSVNAPVGAWTVIEIVARWWYWIFLAGIVGILGGYFFGQKFFETGFIAYAELLQLDPKSSLEHYQPRQLTEEGFSRLLKSPDLLAHVGKIAKPPIRPDELGKRTKVTSDGDSEIFTLSIMAASPERAVELVNLYAQEARRFTADQQRREVGEYIELMKQQLLGMDTDLEQINKQLREVPRTTATPPSQRGATLQDMLLKEEQELLNLRSQFTDVHPKVQQQLIKIETLRKQLQALQQPVVETNAAPVTSVHDVDFSALQRQNLDHSRLVYVTRLREAQAFLENPPGYFDVFAPAEGKNVKVADAKFKIIMSTVLGGLASLGACLVFVLLIEVLDQRIKTLDDLKRVTGLRVLGTLGNIRRMTQAEQNNWAFRTWTALQCSLSASPNHGLICGITSAGHGEGRSTWVNLLAKAAGQCGFRVLTIGTVQVADEETLKNCSPQQEDGAPCEAENVQANGHPRAADGSDFDPTETTALMTRILSTPSQVTQQLTGHDPQQFVHIPLPGWVWNLERRKQWQGALGQWKRIEHVVIFVELPPASMPETVLLATKLPNVIWLARSGKARASQTRACIQTLRDARVNLVGCVMNKDTGASVKKCFSRWISGWIVAALLGLGQLNAQERSVPTDDRTLDSLLAQVQTNTAQQTVPAPIDADRPATSVSNISFSAASRTQRADWQKRFTLGPGDVLNLSLFGQADADRKEVPIAPDGRVTFLQAEVIAAGLTVDELRAKLDEDLAKFYRAPRTIVSPVTVRSKKYYVLGKVTNRGVYSLDRPTSLIEAVARAHGIETGLLDENDIIDLADLQRSFLMRNGKRVEVNLEKLFQEGDLSQNILLEPEDFLYFASMAMKEVYVLGEVQAPGALPWKASTTAITAIADRGGFSHRAYKSKVVVIRGSLNNPRTFIVNVWSTFEARHLDFKLEPKDIVYVHYRPFIYVEDLLDAAVSTFLQSVAAGVATEKVGPLITEPILRFSF
jgi:protein involved in polysaccharide export with SLBB domain/capsular polysaccharide biosynthesis protein